ncbi:MAG: hypothetical protein ABI780_05245 [Ardenticatenales bacterium]
MSYRPPVAVATAPHTFGPRRAIAAAAAVAVALTIGAVAALIGAQRQHAMAQDEPPTASVQQGGVVFDGRLGTHIWGGRAVDYRGIMTARTPFTAVAGSAATLGIQGVDDPPASLSATWYDVGAQEPDDAGADWAAWRPTSPGVPVADAAAVLRQGVRLPRLKGRWLLHVVAVWDGEGRGDVGWGWLFDIVGADEVPERTYTGLYMSGFESSAFISGTDRCPGDWWVSAPADTGFGERYRAVVAAQSGVVHPYDDFSPVETTFRARLSPPGHYGHLGGFSRIITVTQLIAMSPTLRCGMDKADLALVDPWYDYVCAPVDGLDRRIRFALANIGSQPFTRTVAVVVRDAVGAEVDRFEGLGPVEAGGRRDVERRWQRPLPLAAPVSLEIEGTTNEDDRYSVNNRVAVPQVTMTPPNCPTATATPGAHVDALYFPLAIDGSAGVQ